MQHITTDMLAMAAQFVNSTASHIFLTGKAGTGKTTFLRDLAQKTHKTFAIVAPTGIAALNAQGVTIHSQFLLPFGSFVPGQSLNLPPGRHSSFYNQKMLAQKHPLNKRRKEVLRAIDLLIIDEVSMLRADILDAIDYRLKSAKGNFSRAFGGVQLLMIGDLYQLPPIVKDDEWAVLKNHYRTIHFFEAQAIKQGGMVYIELDKIFRQQDDAFIRILNNLRNNITTPQDIEALNQYYKPADQIEENGVITITTHNYKADKINQDALQALSGEMHFYSADIQDDFPESMYPLPETISLKIGAQVMFIKNDSSGGGAYYNGKLAVVVDIDEEGIWVETVDEQSRMLLKQEKWEHKRYTVSEKSKDLEEEVLGAFFQFPVKLAWAVTVHKSQGLTFDKAIIDVGQAFAPGQVYVALSRLRSLGGLTLRTRINPGVISSDAEVVAFSSGKDEPKKLAEKLERSQGDYLLQTLFRTFDFSAIEKQIEYFLRDDSHKAFADAEMQVAMPNIRARLLGEKQNTEKFRHQLYGFVQQNNHQKLVERVEKGSGYYTEFMRQTLRMLYTHIAEVERFSRTSQYKNGLSEIDQLMMLALADIERATEITRCVLSKLDISRNAEQDRQRAFWRQRRLEEAREKALTEPRLAGATKSGRQRKKGERSAKPPKGSTFKTTYALIKEGMSLKEIATTRELALSTIEGHAVKGIKSGEISVQDILPQPLINVIAEAFKNQSNITDVFKHFDTKISYDTLRMVQADLQKD